MRILHYLFGLPPVYKGGVPAYVLDLVHVQQTLGHQVYLLMPGKIMKDSNEISILSKRRYGVECYEIVNSSYIANGYGVIDPDYFMRPAPLHKYIKLLVDRQIQILHLHSMLGLQAELLLAAKKLGIPIVYTTHDYYGLCPKIDLLKDDEQCSATDWSRCIDCCQQAYSLGKLRFRQTALYRWYCRMPFVMKALHCQGVSWGINRIYHKMKVSSSRKLENQLFKARRFQALQQYFRLNYEMIDCYHFNSLQSKEIYEAHLGTLSGEILTISTANIIDHRKRILIAPKLRIGYLGNPDIKKGYYYLLKQLDLLYLSGRSEFQLETYFVKEIEKRPYQKNHAPFSSKQQEKVYRNMDMLIVPSIYKETFGLVVLEALSYGVPVLVSENVGAKELLHCFPGIGHIFSLKNDQLSKMFEQIYDNHNLLEAMNEAICTSDINFNFNEHVLKIVDVYTKLKN